MKKSGNEPENKKVATSVSYGEAIGKEKAHRRGRLSRVSQYTKRNRRFENWILQKLFIINGLFDRIKKDKKMTIPK